MVSTQPAESDIGRNFYETVLRPAWQRLADRFELMMDEGILKRADPWVTAMHWKGLNEWDFFEKRLLGAMPGPPDNVAEVAELAADAFLEIYGTNGKRAGKRETPKGPLKRKAS